MLGSVISLIVKNFAENVSSDKLPRLLKAGDFNATCMCMWLAILKEGSDETQSVDCRLACAESISSSKAISHLATICEGMCPLSVSSQQPPITLAASATSDNLHVVSSWLVRLHLILLKLTQVRIFHQLPSFHALDFFFFFFFYSLG